MPDATCKCPLLTDSLALTWVADYCEDTKQTIAVDQTISICIMKSFRMPYSILTLEQLLPKKVNQNMASKFYE